MAAAARDPRTGRFVRPAYDGDLTQPFPVLDDLSAWERELGAVELPPARNDAGPLIAAGIILVVIVVALVVATVIATT